MQLKIFSYGYDLPCVRLWIQEKSNKNELLAVPLRTNNRKERFKNNVLLQRGGNKEFRMIIVSECRGFTKPINDIDLFGNTPDNLSKATENNETIEIDLHQEFIGGSAITVYPNPSDNKLNITFSGFDDANNSLLLKYDVNVLDILGKTVDKQQIRTGETISINTVDLPEGIYFVQVKGFYTSSYQPVIIKR